MARAEIPCQKRPIDGARLDDWDDVMIFLIFLVSFVNRPPLTKKGILYVLPRPDGTIFRFDAHCPSPNLSQRRLRNTELDHDCNLQALSDTQMKV